MPFFSLARKDWSEAFSRAPRLGVFFSDVAGGGGGDDPDGSIVLPVGDAEDCFAVLLFVLDGEGEEEAAAAEAGVTAAVEVVEVGGLDDPSVNTSCFDLDFVGK